MILAIMIGLMSLTGLTSRAVDQGRGRYVGYIDQLQFGAKAQATVTVSNVVTGTSITLTSTNAGYFRLYEQDEIKCADGTLARINLRFGTAISIVDTNWSRIPMPPNPKEASQQAQRNALLQESLMSASRDRGGGSTQVFDPANGSVVRLGETFSIHWIPPSGAVNVAFEIANPISGFSWRTNTLADSGFLVLPDLLPQLHQEQENGAGQFELRCQFDHFTAVTSEFSILSRNSEEKLATQLQDETRGLSKKEASFHLIRAALFNRFHLSNEAAEEYEAAANCPGESESIGLLERLKEASDLIGNYDRSTVITEHIKALEMQR